MPEAVIAEAVRTPIEERRGALSDVQPVDLSAHVLSYRPAASLSPVPRPE